MKNITIYINQIVISNKVSFGKKKDLDISLVTKILKNQTFMYIFPKMIAYRRDFDETKYISFFYKR